MYQTFAQEQKHLPLCSQYVFSEHKNLPISHLKERLDFVEKYFKSYAQAKAYIHKEISEYYGQCIRVPSEQFINLE